MLMLLYFSSIFVCLIIFFSKIVMIVRLYSLHVSCNSSISLYYFVFSIFF